MPTDDCQYIYECTFHSQRLLVPSIQIDRVVALPE